MIVSIPESVLARLREFPAFVRARSRAIPRAQWVQKPSPREFALVEHACHLRDFEIEGFQLRVRRVLAEDRPEIVDFDGLAIAAARDYLAQDPDRALDAFASARAASVDHLARLTHAELARTARFPGEGVITLARLAELLVDHDASHREELDRLVGELREASGA